MYSYADWFPEFLAAAAAPAEKGRAASEQPMATQALVNASRTLNLVLDVLFEQFRDVYAVIQERLKQERERSHAVPTRT
jgi:hypothetical protein